MGYAIKRNQTARPLLFKLYDSADHLTGATGKTPTVTLSKNGAAFASPSGAVTELANGWYKVAGNATDTNTLGPLVLHATASGSDECAEVFEVVAFDPELATNLGLSDFAAVQSAVAAVQSDVTAVLTDTGTTLPALLADVPTDVLAAGDVDGYTLEEALKLCLAVLVGRLSGADGSTVVFRAADDSKVRVTAAVDTTGRLTVTLDAAG